KDFAEINAAKEVWPQSDIQLCQWHIDQAINKKLKSKKRIQYTQYQPEEAAAEFSFINPKFKPELNRSDPDYYQVCLLDLRKDIMNLIRKHFNMHPKIPINADGKCLTSAEIREHAVLELYSFCVEHNFVILWSYLWSSWYKISRWHLWARLMRATIPIGKMNMIIESHWKQIYHGRITPKWFEKFKKTWNQLAEQLIADNMEN
ncbi:5568_t:CDS:2, partial [Scutellospora calospora]